MLHVSVSLALRGTIQLNLSNEIQMKVSLYPWKEWRDVFMNSVSCFWFRMQKRQLKLQQPFWIMSWQKNSENSREGNYVVGCHHDVAIAALVTYLFHVIEKSTSIFFKPQSLGFMSHAVEYNSTWYLLKLYKDSINMLPVEFNRQQNIKLTWPPSSSPIYSTPV